MTYINYKPRRDYFLNEGFFPDEFCENDILVEKQKEQPSPPLGPFDVVCGRCKAAFNNEGNQRFREIIAENLQRYIDAPTRVLKGKVILSVVDILTLEKGARFFKLTNNGNTRARLNQKTIRQKVGHALRDMAAYQNPNYYSSSLLVSPRPRSLSSSVAKRQRSTSSVSTTATATSETTLLQSDNDEDTMNIIQNTIIPTLCDEEDDLYITDDLSVEEEEILSISSANQVFPDIPPPAAAVDVVVTVTPEAPKRPSVSSQYEDFFGKMMHEIDNLDSLLEDVTIGGVDDDYDLIGFEVEMRK